MKRKEPRISGGIGSIGAQEPETQESQLVAPSGTKWHPVAHMLQTGSPFGAYLSSPPRDERRGSAHPRFHQF